MLYSLQQDGFLFCDLDSFQGLCVDSVLYGMQIFDPGLRHSESTRNQILQPSCCCYHLSLWYNRERKPENLGFVPTLPPNQLGKLGQDTLFSKFHFAFLSR
jgi:hypothetical protein